MPDINWNVAVQIAGGPSLARSASVAVDAYDKIEVTVPAGEQNLEVPVAPANADIRFLMRRPALALPHQQLGHPGRRGGDPRGPRPDPIGGTSRCR